MFVHNALVDYAVRLVLATREPAAARPARRRPADPVRRQPARLARHRPGRPGAGAACAGRDYALPQDLHDIAPDILRHRLVLSYDALADDIPADHIVDRVLQAVPLPTVAPRQSADAGQRPTRAAAGRRPHRAPRHRAAAWPSDRP